jgi:multiple sugar transport system ATP-binding protein
MATVRFEQVRKVFPGGVEVVRGVDLEVADGELVTFVGPSGCGKSTMLNLVAGFERPTSGHVRIDGEIVDDRAPKDRGVAMVFQSYALYPHLDVRRNIAFPLEVAGLDRKSRDARVLEMAERMGLGGLLDRRPRDLSGGQRQRVALARALVRRPRLCLFDEPLSNLDAALRAQMRAEIKKLHEELGATFLYVTHDQAEAMTLSDRIVVLQGGAVQQVAPPRELYARPSNSFVAAFVGSPKINLLPPAMLGLGRAGGAGGAEALVAGLRPEDAVVGQGEPPAREAGRGLIEGRVYVTEPVGPETWVTIEAGSERVTGRAPAAFDAPTGERAWLTFDERRVLFFDAKTGERRTGR